MSILDKRITQRTHAGGISNCFSTHIHPIHICIQTHNHKETYVFTVLTYPRDPGFSVS